MPVFSRRLLFSAGSGVLGIAVVETLAGCSRSSPSPAGGSASGPASGSASWAAGTIGGWRRANLSFVSAYVLVRGAEVGIVDLGTAGSGTAIGTVLQHAGTGWGAVRHILLTHRHPDHAGGLAEVAPQVKATIYTGTADVAGVRGTAAIKAVQDGDEVFGWRIIGTPGHTEGHVSVYDPATKVLVAGDALRTTDGLAGSDPKFTADAAAATASVKKLAALEVMAILPGHGDPLTLGAQTALRKLAASL